MDIKEFLKELDGRGFDFQDKSYTEFGFNDEILNMVYEMYCAGQQAQAVPDQLDVNSILHDIDCYFDNGLSNTERAANNLLQSIYEKLGGEVKAQEQDHA